MTSIFLDLNGEIVDPKMFNWKVFHKNTKEFYTIREKKKEEDSKIFKL